MSQYGRMWNGLGPTEHPTMRDIAWAAGVYEGEGSCNLSTGKSPQLSIAQKNRWLCDRMRALFGGSVRAATSKASVLPDGKPYPDRKIFVWGLSGARARGFLMTIYGRLSLRRRVQVARVFEWDRPSMRSRTLPVWLSTRDIAWAAGVYEGEGTCQKSNSGSATASVSQKDPWLLYRLQNYFGGAVSSYNNRGRKHHRWMISGPRARGFLMTVYAFLSPYRKEQAQAVLP